MTTPQLYVFAISHYCEKARWALDYLAIDYALEFTAPGLHGELATRLGAGSSSLPLLVVGQQPVQGSGQIIDWALANTRCDRSLGGGDGAQQAIEIERRLDDIIGIHVRRMYYSEALLEHPATVLPIFRANLPVDQQQFVSQAWELIVPAMVDGMDLGPEQGLVSRDILLQELDWLDSLLADGRPYLVGDNFSRADLTAASLLAPLAQAPEHPSYADLQVPPRVAADITLWQQRPVLQWVKRLYQQHR